jgi:hypothetical protein
VFLASSEIIHLNDSSNKVKHVFTNKNLWKIGGFIDLLTILFVIYL